jgi:hypothetical protein
VRFEVTDCYKSVARNRLVKTDNPGVYAAVKYKSAVLPLVPSSVYKVPINPIIQHKTLSISHKLPTCDNI